MSECAMVKQCTTGKKEKETQIKRLSLSTSPPYYKGKKKMEDKTECKRERERKKERERERERANVG